MNDGGPRPRALTVVRQEQTLGAGRDLAFGLELLARAKSGDIGPTLRLYRPAPTVAFGQRDTRLPGFDAAAKACRANGFEPLVRRAGGRAAAYHEGTLVVDRSGRHRRFQDKVWVLRGAFCGRPPPCRRAGGRGRDSGGILPRGVQRARHGPG